MHHSTVARLYRFTLVATASMFVTHARAADVLISNFSSNSVERFDSTGNHLGGLTGGPAITGPLCTRFGPDGLLYVAAEGADAIYRYNPTTFTYLDTFVAPGSGGLDAPTAMTWGPDGALYVDSFTNNNVLRYNGSNGAFVDEFIAPGAGGLNGADNGMTFGPDGNLYIPSYNNNRILRYNGTTGAFVGIFGGSTLRPRIIIFRDSFVYVTSESSQSVRRYFATNGTFAGNFVAPGSGGLAVPIGMAFGDDGFLYVASGLNDNVLRFNGATGAFVDVFAAAPDDPIDAPTFITIVPEPASVMIPISLLVGIASSRGSARRRRGSASC